MVHPYVLAFGVMILLVYLALLSKEGLSGTYQKKGALLGREKILTQPQI
jgi:hypothetical protein